jgi:hypothetical protein
MPFSSTEQLLEKVMKHKSIKSNYQWNLYEGNTASVLTLQSERNNLTVQYKPPSHDSHPIVHRKTRRLHVPIEILNLEFNG